uniref:8-oxo-dGTP diphosphatase n=1 Tax=Bosea sp. NBC_00436 TaxID=2969620 RepID=A0A9E8CTJ9_9HYPH
MVQIVNAVFVGPEGVLLARRSPHRKNYPDRWSFPGGHVEEDESLDDALVREIGEELAVSPLAFEPFMQIPDPHAAAKPITYHMYLVRAWRGTPKIVDAEHTELRWFSVDQACRLDNLALEEYVSLFDKLREMAR